MSCRVQSVLFRESDDPRMHFSMSCRVQSALLRESDDPRMHFSVSRQAQNALFREPSGGPGHRVRFYVRRRHVCAGEEKRILRKDAFWVHALTEKRILAADPHGKAQFGQEVTRGTIQSSRSE